MPTEEALDVAMRFEENRRQVKDIRAKSPDGEVQTALMSVMTSMSKLLMDMAGKILVAGFREARQAKVNGPVSRLPEPEETVEEVRNAKG
jgi:hypothetical protein